MELDGFRPFCGVVRTYENVKKVLKGKWSIIVINWEENEEEGWHYTWYIENDATPLYLGREGPLSYYVVESGTIYWRVKMQKGRAIDATWYIAGFNWPYCTGMIPDDMPKDAVRILQLMKEIVGIEERED